MATTSRDLLTAADVARCCRVDIKTIHNWTSRGELPHFRTPGRHLRFRRADVLDFLRHYGYPVPAWLHSGPPSVALLGPATQLAALQPTLAEDFTLSLYSEPCGFLLAMGAAPPDAAVLLSIQTPPCPPPLLVRVLRAHAGTEHTRLVTIGPPESNGLDLGASAHLPSLEAGSLRQTLTALLGTQRITS